MVRSPMIVRAASDVFDVTDAILWWSVSRSKLSGSQVPSKGPEVAVVFRFGPGSPFSQPVIVAELLL